MGYSEYEKVKELRHAIAAIPVAQRQIETAEKMREKYHRDIDEAKHRLNSLKPCVCTPFTDRVTAEFEKKERELDAVATKEAWNKVQQTNSNVTTLIVVMLVLLAFVAFGFFLHLSFIAGEWSWSSSIDKMLSKGLTYKTAVGIHLFSFCFVLLITYGIITMLGGDCRDDVWIWGKNVLGFIFIVLAVISIIASFVYYYADVSGFWRSLGRFLVAFINIFHAFRSFFKAFIFVLCAVTTLGAPIGLFVLCHYLRENKIQTKSYSKVVVHDAVNALDHRPLYASEIYKEAQQLDEEASKLETEKLIARHKANIAKLQNCASSCWSEIHRCEKTITDCNYIIRNATFLHPSYRNLQSLDIILYYFEHNRATTIVQAINEYTHDRQFESITRAVNQMTNRLNSMENTITHEISKAREATEAQIAAINESRLVYERSIQEQERNAQARADAFNARFDQMIANQAFSQRILNDQFNAVMKKL